MKMFDIIRAALFTPTPWGWGLPILVTGAPGEGKSSVAAAVCEATSMPYVLLSPGETGEAYFGAVPAVTGGVIDYPRPGWTDEVAVGGAVIVDEIRTAPIIIRPALLGLTLDRRVGGHSLGRDVAVIALSNSAEDSPNGLPLDPPQANRFVHISWGEMTGAETGAVVCRQLTSGGRVVPEGGSSWVALRKEMLERAPAVMAEVGAMIEQFLAENQQWARRRPAEGEGDGPWPSPRSWALAGCGIAAARLHGLGESGERLFGAGAVGAAAYAALRAWAMYRGLPSASALVSGGVWHGVAAARSDQVAYVLDGVVALTTDTTADYVINLLLDWSQWHREIVAAKIAALIPSHRGALMTATIRRCAAVLG